MCRKLCFRYNSAFLPEFLTTLAISVPVSLFFMTSPLGGMQRGGLNPHVPAALAAYCGIGGGMIFLSVWYRIRYWNVRISGACREDLILHVHGRRYAVAELDKMEVRIGSFFGRAARVLSLTDAQGSETEVCEAVVRFDDLQHVLAQLSGKPARRSPRHLPAEFERLIAAWNERHKFIPEPQTAEEMLNRFGWRFVCVLPVAVFDVVINVAVILLLNRFQRMELMVYSAPLSLLASGVIARYVYYYLFTSTAMYRPLGLRQLIAQPAGSSAAIE